MALSSPENAPVSLERERERTIELLSRHFAYDNLTLEELERRIESVYQAASLQAIREVTSDLPDATPAHARAAAGLPALPQDHGRIVSIMVSTRRTGIWQPARRLDLLCVMSDTNLDLTHAELAPGVTEIHINAVMASLKVTVPPGVRVVCQPSAFMASVEDNTLDPPAVGSAAPVVRITGRAIMASLELFTRTRELSEG